MQQVPAIAGHAVAAQLGEAGGAPDVGFDAPVFLQQAGSFDDLTQDDTRAHELDTRCLGIDLGSLRAVGRRRAFMQQVHAADDAFLVALPKTRMGVVLVHHRDVVVDVLLALDHAHQAFMQDDAHLVRERRVVGDAVRDGQRHDVAVAVLVLQALAVEGGAAGGAADEEAPCLHVARRPG